MVYEDGAVYGSSFAGGSAVKVPDGLCLLLQEDSYAASTAGLVVTAIFADFLSSWVQMSRGSLSSESVSESQLDPILSQRGCVCCSSLTEAFVQM